MNRDIKEVKKISARITEIRGIEKDAFALYLEGAVKNFEEEYEEAKKIFAEALSIDEKIPEVYPDYAFILESIDKNYIEAVKLLERAIEIGFKQVLIYNNLAFSYIRMGELKKAEKILSNFNITEDGATPPILFATYGLLEIRKGNLEKGNIFYKKAIEGLQGGNSKIAKQIQLLENARYFFEKKEAEKAREFLAQAKELPKSYVSREIIELGEKIDLL